MSSDVQALCWPTIYTKPHGPETESLLCSYKELHDYLRERKYTENASKNAKRHLQEKSNHFLSWMTCSTTKAGKEKNSVLCVSKKCQHYFSRCIPLSLAVLFQSDRFC